MASGAANGPIVQYWHDDPPDYIAALMASVGEQNPHAEHLVFDRQEAEDLIASRFGPREVAAFRACGPAAMQADYFRYCAVHALGGAYLDADYVCIGSLGEMLDGDDEGVIFKTDFGTITNACFGFRGPGHPLLDLAREIATTLIERRVVGDVSMTTGPAVFSGIYWLSQVRSIDTFRDYVANGRDPVPEDLFDPALLGELATALSYARRAVTASLLLCDVTSEYGRTADPLAGVRVAPSDDLLAWLQTPDQPLPYKKSESDWRRAGQRIYVE